MAIRASIDGFHAPCAVRYRDGDAAQAYYSDSFDYDALRCWLLEPLGTSGTRKYRTAVFDYRTNTGKSGPTQTAASDAILIFDGVFLLRSALNQCWDLSTSYM